MNLDFGSTFDFGDAEEGSSIDLFDAFDLDSLDGYDGNILEADSTQTRLMQPRISKPVRVAYKFARRMAAGIELKSGANYYAIVSGEFIFGDLLEALIVDKGEHIKSLEIATLSISQENIDSLRNIMESGFCLRLNLIVSHYFYAHERKGLIPYIYQELDRGERFQLSVAGNHTKIVCFETWEGLKFTIHGSANLRSSANVEQFALTEDPELFDFNMAYMNKIHQQYATIRQNTQAAKAAGVGTIAGRGKAWHRVQAVLKRAEAN